MQVTSLDISTHTPLTGRDLNGVFHIQIIKISTHTPLTGRDHLSCLLTRFLQISTHTPLTGRDELQNHKRHIIVQFLLTRPLRDVTAFNFVQNTSNGFLLTRPLRDVTACCRWLLEQRGISTHTPLTGRDRYALACNFPLISNFYSHAPYGT